MSATDPRAKDKKKEDRPESTGKAYEQLVEELFMGDSTEETEETKEEETSDTE